MKTEKEFFYAITGFDAITSRGSDSLGKPSEFGREAFQRKHAVVPTRRNG
jgi:hypothetical protein